MKKDLEEKINMILKNRVSGIEFFVSEEQRIGNLSIVSGWHNLVKFTVRKNNFYVQTEETAIYANGIMHPRQDFFLLDNVELRKKL